MRFKKVKIGSLAQESQICFGIFWRKIQNEAFSMELTILLFLKSNPIITVHSFFESVIEWNKPLRCGNEQKLSYKMFKKASINQKIKRFKSFQICFFFFVYFICHCIKKNQCLHPNRRYQVQLCHENKVDESLLNKRTENNRSLRGRFKMYLA